MIRKRGKFVCVLLSCMVVLSLAGCSKTKKVSNTNANAGDISKISFPLKKPITITAMTYDFGRSKTLKIDKEWEKATNVKVKWTLVSPSDYDNVLKVKLSSGELPDLMKTSKTVLDTYGAQGLFADLKPYIGKTTNIKKWVEKYPAILNDIVTAENKCYGLDNFNTRGQIPKGFIYRDDIFKKAGL